MKITTAILAGLFALGSASVFAEGGAERMRYYYDNFPVQHAQSAYTVVSLMSRYEFDRHLSASLNVNNLFDKKYYDNVGFYNGVYLGDPRTVTLSLDWKL